MSLDRVPGFETEEEAECEERAYHPPPPLDDSFDVATTVDPGYIISLIRKLLLPKNVCAGKSQFKREGDKFAYPEVSVSEDDDSQSRDETPCNESEGHEVLTEEQAWEESGCILWDLSASETHAEFMVENLLLDVLLTSLAGSQSMRIKEIGLGIIANVACHKPLMKNIICTDGLLDIIVDHIFEDDSSCLCEAFRLLSAGLQSTHAIMWAEALHSEAIISRLLWITENTLNLNLIEKSAALLLAAIENGEAACVFLPAMVKSGLPDLLIKLLSFEMEILMNARNSDRYTILDLILLSVEALSTTEAYSTEICSHKELWTMICDLVKLPDKIEVASSCITAAVLLGNLLIDVADPISILSIDLDFLCGLVDILPFASGDAEARAAVWSILGRLLEQVLESNSNPSTLLDCILVLAKKAELIEDDLLEQVSISSAKFGARDKALRKMVEIYSKWAASDSPASEQQYEEYVGRLMELCQKHIL